MARLWMSGLVVLTLAFGGCASTRSQSVRQAGYAGHPKRIYVLVMPELNNQMGADFVQGSVAKLSDAIAKCGGILASHVSSALELDASAQIPEIKAFNPDAVMSMDFAGGTRDQYGGWLPARIDVRLWQPGAKQLAWRDTSSVSAGGFTPLSTRVDSFINDLVQRMRTDNVFPDCNS